MISSRVALAVGAAALLVATTASCNSDPKAGGTPSRSAASTASTAASPAPSSPAANSAPPHSSAPSAAGGSGSPCPQLPIPDGVTVKDRNHTDVNGVACVQYRIDLTVSSPKAAYDSAIAKAKDAGYEIGNAGREPAGDWSFEAKDYHGSLPYGIITYLFYDDHTGAINAEIHHN